jgi:hypothetical protein
MLYITRLDRERLDKVQLSISINGMTNCCITPNFHIHSVWYVLETQVCSHHL